MWLVLKVARRGGLLVLRQEGFWEQHILWNTVPVAHLEQEVPTSQSEG